MARVTPPSPYVSWNVYIRDRLNGLVGIEERRQFKRDIKLERIASVERYANGDTTSPSYREYNIYETPGTVSPTPVHPWLSTATNTLSELLTEDGDYITTEDGYEIATEGPVDTPYPP